MTDARHYLDHNATTPLHPAAREAMVRAFDLSGNPSSVHAEGRSARAVIEEARRSVAALVGAAPENVVFTSGGTEALNIALTPDMAVRQPCERLLVGAGEHPAVLAGHRFGDRVATVPLTSAGTVDLAALERLVDGRPVMLALQAANNETGVLQPVAAAAAIVKAAGGTVVCDAVQVVGKIACSLASLDTDAVAISAHKFGGPKGVGALCFAGPHPHLRHGVVRGGGQEGGLRAGTENIVGIAGLGAACGPAAERVAVGRGEMGALRDGLEDALRAVAPGLIIFGEGTERLPNTSSVAVPGFDAQVMLIKLDLDGFAVSGGSACAAGRAKASHVLTAMGIPGALAASAIRVSLGWTTRRADVDAFAAAFERASGTMRPRVAA